eukprot:1139828-Pelagomonas_calceolata.AAC.4
MAHSAAVAHHNRSMGTEDDGSEDDEVMMMNNIGAVDDEVNAEAQQGVHSLPFADRGDDDDAEDSQHLLTVSAVRQAVEVLLALAGAATNDDGVELQVSAICELSQVSVDGADAQPAAICRIQKMGNGERFRYGSRSRLEMPLLLVEYSKGGALKLCQSAALHALSVRTGKVSLR